MTRRLVVIGAGVIGASTADVAAAAGWQVTLIDAASPPAPLASSHDLSKVIRAAYGAATPRYGPLVVAARRAWRDLERTSGAALLHGCGAAVLADDASPGTFVAESHRHLTTLGERVDLLDPQDAQRRWPGLRLDGVGVVLHDVDAGWIAASEAVRALVGRAIARGATLRQGVAVRAIEATPHGPVVRHEGGDERADAVVVAAGPWVSRLLPHAPAAVTRQQITLFRPPDPSAWAAPRCPVWIRDLDGDGWYGFPTHPSGVVKVGHHRLTEAVDPDTDRTPDPDALTAAADAAGRWLGMPRETAATASTCLYTNAPTGDVVVDHVPGLPGVVLAGLGSGHAFKLGPALGQLALALLSGAAPTLPWPSSGARRVW